MKNYQFITIILLLFFLQNTTFAGTFKVANTNNSGSGSLRAAIQLANSTFGTDNIIFDIPGIAPHSIVISGSALPAITEAVIIDGTTQPANGFAGVSPKIIITRSLNSSGLNGLNITAADVEIYGLYVTGFDYNGVVVSGDRCKIGAPGKGNVFSGNESNQLQLKNLTGGSIQSNKIGTDTTGTLPALLNEGYHGISMESVSFTTIGGGASAQGNLISGNDYTGITMACCLNNSIFNNKIGTDITGKFDLGNQYSGIRLNRPSSNFCSSENNVIGEIDKGNLISGNQYHGIDLSCASNNLIFNNLIGTDISGKVVIPNEYSGINIDRDSYQSISVCSGDNNVIGELNKGNLISGNKYYGISVSCSSSNTIFNNYIGTDITGTLSIPNEYGGANIQQEVPFPGEPECLTQNNLVGAIGKGNLIGNNLGYGISVVGAKSTGNKLTQNSIFCNTNGGINLTDQNGYGIGSGNLGYTAPIISTATNNSASGTAAPNDLIELFIDDSCPDCQGKTYVGTTVADALGDWMFTGQLSGTIVATATDTFGNTSPFSACAIVTNLCTDLTPVMNILPNNIAGPSSVQVAVKLSEIHNVDTDGTVITVRIPSDPRFVFVWDIGLTFAAFTPVQNSDWNYLGDNGVFHSWSFNGNGLILEGLNTTAFGFYGFYDPQGTDGQTTLTATVVPQSGGECNFVNNSDSETLIYFQ